MSRVGKKPISIPKGIEVTVDNGVVTVKKGNKAIDVNTHNRVGVEVKDGNIEFTLVGETSQDKAYWGTYRALTNNAVVGLDKGFSKSLEINGVGYRAAVKGKVLELQLGFSHQLTLIFQKGWRLLLIKTLSTSKGVTSKLLDKLQLRLEVSDHQSHIKVKV